MEGGIAGVDDEFEGASTGVVDELEGAVEEELEEFPPGEDDALVDDVPFAVGAAPLTQFSGLRQCPVALQREQHDVEEGFAAASAAASSSQQF